MKRNRWVAASTLLTAALGVIGLVAPGGVAAATPPSPTAFDVIVGAQCVGNDTDSSTTFTLDWKTAAAATVVHQSVTTDVNGHWEVCSASHLVTQGDTLSASNGSGTNTYIVPNLTLHVSRVGNFLNGRAPAGSIVRAHCDFASGFEGCVWQDQVRTGPNGYWSMQIKFDVLGGQTYDVRVRDDNGNRTTVDGTAPFVNVELGSADVYGALDAGANRTIWLYDGSMNLKGTTSVTGSAVDGTFSTKFRDSQGDAVAVATGDTVKATTISADAKLLVPAITATATASNDRVTGACGDTGRSLGYANVFVYRTGQLRGVANFQGDGTNGAFSFNFRRLGFLDNEANVKPGDRLVIHCVQSGQDDVLLTIHAS